MLPRPTPPPWTLPNPRLSAPSSIPPPPSSRRSTNLLHVLVLRPLSPAHPALALHPLPTLSSNLPPRPEFRPIPNSVPPQLSPSPHIPISQLHQFFAYNPISAHVHPTSFFPVFTKNRLEALSVEPCSSDNVSPPATSANTKPPPPILTNTATNVSNPIDNDKKQTIPPFVLRDKSSWIKVSQHLTSNNVHFSKAVNAKDGINIYTTTEDQYHTL